MCTPNKGTNKLFFKRRIHFRVLAKLFGLEVCLVYFSETGFFFVKQASFRSFYSIAVSDESTETKKSEQGWLESGSVCIG